MSESFERDRENLADADLTALYRETQDLEPPLHLDSRVLAAARRGAQPRKARRAWRWAVPVSVAAVLVLTVGLVRLMRHELSYDSQIMTRGSSLEEQGESATSLRSAPMPGGQVTGRQAPRILPDTAAPSQEQESGRRQALPASPPAQPQADAFTDDRMLHMREKAAKKEALKHKDQHRDEPVLPPQVWLKKIAELRRQGRTAKAEESLRAFRRHYPDYPLDSLPKLPED
jgi:hypothetical protein